MSAAKTNPINRRDLPASENAGTRRAEPRPVEKGQAIRAHEIAKSVWEPFCAWFSSSFHDLDTTIERSEGAERFIVECRDQRFDSIRMATQPDGVLDIKVVVGYDRKKRTVEVSGPQWLRLHYNAAGWPTLLEIGYEEGTLALRFSGAARLGPTFTGNSWGE